MVFKLRVLQSSQDFDYEEKCLDIKFTKNSANKGKKNNKQQ